MQLVFPNVHIRKAYMDYDIILKLLSDHRRRSKNMKKRKSTRKKKVLDLCNKKKLKIEEYDGDEDRLSKLSEEIFGRIISFLPFKDAVATSSISRQWRSVWRFTGSLNFDGEDTVRLLTMNYVYDPDTERCRFIEWVNGVIKQHLGEIDVFKVYFDLDSSSTSIIDGWIQFAMERRAKALQLEFLDGGLPRRSDAYILKREMFEHVKNVAWFGCVKVLDLRSVTVSGDLMEYLLSNCPNLEEFHVNMSPEVVDLEVHGPVLALKHLTIYTCEQITSVEIIDASNLVSFYFDCRSPVSPPKLVIRNAPMLVDAYIHLYNMHLCIPLVFDILSPCLSQLCILQLHVSCKAYLNGLSYPMLPNLKELRLILSQLYHHNLLHIISFMNLSPCLTKLLLKLESLSRGRGR